jgi:hypothetical protein
VFGFEVFTALTVKNAIFGDVTLVTLARTDVSVEGVASSIGAQRNSELETALAVTISAKTVSSLFNSVASYG